MNLQVLNLEQIRMMVTTILSGVIAYFAPTHGFMVALALFFAFNIWCGMRADGVSIKAWRNFSMSKFKNAMAELLIYILLLTVIFTSMERMEDNDEAIVVVKIITYVCMYVYAQNSLKNLIIAYPKNKTYRILYHLLRLEFKKAMPGNVATAIDSAEKEMEENDNETNT